VEFSLHSIPTGWKDGEALGESLVQHSVPALAMTTLECVIYLVGGVVVDASWSSSEGLLGGLQPGQGGGRLRWSSPSSLRHVMTLLLLEALFELRRSCFRLLGDCSS
jgi:hypothetical protein